MKWAILLLNWNSADQTAETVQALRSWRRLKPDLCLVDNGSTDADRATLLARCPHERILTPTSNLGYAGGINAALTVLRPDGYDAFMLLNTDVRLPEEDAERLLTRLEENPRLGIVGPVLTEYQGRHVRLDAGGRNIAWHLDTRRRIAPTHSSVSPFDPTVFPCHYVPGTVILIHRKVFDAIGLLDETYFFSGEIADFCTRARQAGFECAVLAAARAEHHSGDSPLRATLYLYYSLRNRFWYVRKFYPQGAPAFYVYWLTLAALMAAGAGLSGRWAKLRAIGLAVRDGMTGRFGPHHEYFIPPRQTPESLGGVKPE